MIPTNPVFTFPPYFDKTIATPVISTKSAVIAPKDPRSFSESISDIFFKADERIKIEAAIDIKAPMELITAFLFLSILLSKTNIPVNSPSKTLTAPKLPVNFSESIIDNTNMDPAMSARDTAIVLSVSAFKVDCNSSKVSVTPDITLLMLPRNPPADLTVLFIFSINLDS